MSEETVTFNLELNTEQALSSIRQLEGLLYRSLALIRRLGLPEDMNQAIYEMQRMIMTIRLLHTAIILLESASGPIGWLRAGVATGTTLVGLGSTIEYEMRGH